MKTPAMTPSRILALREHLQMTQEEFARQLGLSHRSSVCLLEQGTRDPTGPVLRILEMLWQQEFATSEK